MRKLKRQFHIESKSPRKTDKWHTHIICYSESEAKRQLAWLESCREYDTLSKMIMVRDICEERLIYVKPKYKDRFI